MTSIRIDSETKKISVIDTIRKLLSSSTDDKEKSCTIQHLSRKIKTHADREGIDLEYRFRINGRDSPTCVTTLNAVNQFVASFRCSVPEAVKLSLLEELRVAVSPPSSVVIAANASTDAQETEDGEIMDVDIVDNVVDNAVDPNNILQGIRVDAATKLGSVIDVIRMINPTIDSRHASEVFTRLCATEVKMAARCDQLVINGKGRSTPVADAKTLVEIVWLCPGKAAREFRRKSAQTICRVLGGDLTLINEIENRHHHLQQSDEGRAAQDFLLPSEDKMDTVIKEPQMIPLFLQMATANQKNAYVQSCLDDHIKQMGKQFELKQKQFEVEQKQYEMKEKELEMKQKESEIKFIQQGWAFLQELGTDDRDMIYTKDLVKRCIDSSISSVPLSNTSQLVVASAVSTDPQAIEPDDPSVPTPLVHPRYRGQEISMHTVASEIGIRIKSGTEGRIGKEMKRLYAERYGGDASRNIPKRNIPFRGQMFPENTYYSRDSGMMEQAIRSVE